MITLPRVLRSPRLPSLPAAAVRMLELSRDQNTKTSDFVKVVESDPAIAAKILKLANSSFFAFRSPISSIQRAVLLLGLNSVTSIALAFSVARQSTGTGKLAHHFQSYWQRSVLQACAAERLAGHLPDADPSELFLLGLMLDIGQLTLLSTSGKTYGELLDEADHNQEPVIGVERDAFEFDHQTVGRELLTQWRFPDELIELVGVHHDTESIDTAGKRYRLTVSDEKVRLAQLIAAIGDYFFPTSALHARERLLPLMQDVLGLTGADVDDLLESIAEKFRDNAELFDADPDDIPDPSAIMAMVNEQLAAQAMQASAEQNRIEQDRQAIEKQKLRLEAEKAELSEKNSELTKMAMNDPLTGMYNRHFFDETYAAELDMCQRTGKPIGLLFLDIDTFKNINDLHGHQFGDEVLMRVAEQVMNHSRKSDVAARYGGEEFVLLARQPTESGLRSLADRIRQSVESLRLTHEGTPVRVTISIGAAHALPKRVDPELGDRLIAEADGAMYESKRAGRNRVTLRSMLTSAQRELAGMILQRRFSHWLVENAAADGNEVMQAFNRCMPPDERIGEMAIDLGLLEQYQVDELLAAQIEGNMGQRVGELAIERGYLDNERLATLLALQTESPSRLAQLLVRSGCLSPTQAAEAYERYLDSVLPDVNAPKLVV